MEQDAPPSSSIPTPGTKDVPRHLDQDTGIIAEQSYPNIRDVIHPSIPQDIPPKCESLKTCIRNELEVFNSKEKQEFDLEWHVEFKTKYTKK